VRGSKKWGSVTYTVLCNNKGGVEADLTVTKRTGGEYYFAARGGTATKDYEWISRVLEERAAQVPDCESPREVQLHDCSSRYTILSVQGPHCRNLLTSALSAENAKRLADDAEFPFSSCVEVLTIAGHPIAMCLRLTFIGELVRKRYRYIAFDTQA
jgi:glycine cleavage system aminomethyltransferase T